MTRRPISTNPAVPAPRAGDRLWSADDVATYLGVPVSTLYQWRYKGDGPPAYRVGRHLRYDPTALRTWLDTEAAA